ncbi:CDC4 [[Candida] subhashii]|uniref:CDC4 n=1 Tax=[Candida] subhashii TaxID=561895 RepID=A0A8J5QFV7_9ASCO|nr:CDC4 [[Candida] subhashii]KAG7664889.1 CDC4 [[Candida] subhashii]
MTNNNNNNNNYGSSNFTYPLRDYVAKYDYKFSNPNGKLSDVWLHKEYQKLSINTIEGTNTINNNNNISRESRKRNVGDVGGPDDERESMISCDDIIVSDTDTNNSQVSSGHGHSYRQGLIHPPKRRLTSNVLSEMNTTTPFMLDSFAGILSPQQPQHTLMARQQSTANTADQSVLAPTLSQVQQQQQQQQQQVIHVRRPRTPTAINSPSHTPISDIEEDPIQQLPLPSPSASPVQSDIEIPKYSDPIEKQFSNIPTTQGELMDIVTNLFPYFNERNQNHLIFKLLQNINRASLSTFNELIHNSLKRDLLSNLPVEITMKILSYLDSKTLLSLSRVCKKWFEIINNPNLWINILKKDKLITDDIIIRQELANPTQLMQEWGGIPGMNPAQVLYKKRSIIVNRWMNPNYEPKRICVTGHGNKVVTCLQHDDEKIVTGVDDKCILIYSTKTGKLLKVLEGHEGGVWALKYTGNTLVTGSTDRTVRVWNMKTGKCTHVFRGHTSTIRCLDIIHPANIGKDSNGNDIIFPQFPLLVTGSRDHNIHVWRLPLCEDDNDDEDIEDGMNSRPATSTTSTSDDQPTFDSSEIDNPYLLHVLSGHTQSVRSISGYGNIIISGSYDSTVRVWDLLQDGNCKHVLTGHQDRVYSTAMDFNTKTCFSGSMDSNINMWNFETGKLIKTLEGHSSLVGLLDLVDGVLVSAAADATLRIWDPVTGEVMSRLKGHGAAITCFEHDALRVVSGSEKMLKLWDVRRGVFARDLLADVTGGIWQVRIDYRRCVAAVQRFNDDEEGETFIEILDFSEPPKKKVVEGNVSRI